MAEPAEDVEELSTAQTQDSFASALGSRSDEVGGSKSALKPPKPNAFAELMSPKPKVKKPKDGSHPHHSRGPRDGLLPYIQNPESYPRSIVLRSTPNTVLIKDLFPKATIHLLLLPRSPAHYDMHPHDAFDDPQFLAMMKEEAAAGAELAAAELRRLLASTSDTIKARYAAMEADDLPDELPPGRDFSDDIKVGIHAHPSMNHLHVHIMSRDMHSEKLRHRKHYNSFNTPFFIPLSDYPLAEDDEKRKTSYQNANLKKDFTCWRCGKDFGNRFAELKKHLEVEFQAWSKE